MERVLVWDWPVRLMHLLLGAGFIAAAAIAFLGGEHGAWFPYHAVIGLTLGAIVVVRIVWGFIGTRHARFGSFAFGPVAVLGYLRDALVGGGRRHAGHNPGSAWAIFAMLFLVLGLGATGVMMGRGYEGVKEVHEVLAYTMLGVVGLHLLGVVFHTVRHRENIALSMIRGTKTGAPGDAIRSARPVAGLVVLAVIGGWAFALVRNYDAATRTTTVPIWGASLQLGEGEGREGGEGGGGHEREGHDEEHGEDGDD